MRPAPRAPPMSTYRWTSPPAPSPRGDARSPSVPWRRGGGIQRRKGAGTAAPFLLWEPRFSSKAIRCIHAAQHAPRRGMRPAPRAPPMSTYRWTSPPAPSPRGDARSPSVPGGEGKESQGGKGAAEPPPFLPGRTSIPPALRRLHNFQLRPSRRPQPVVASAPTLSLPGRQAHGSSRKPLAGGGRFLQEAGGGSAAPCLLGPSPRSAIGGPNRRTSRPAERGVRGVRSIGRCAKSGPASGRDSTHPLGNRRGDWGRRRPPVVTGGLDEGGRPAVPCAAWF